MEYVQHHICNHANNCSSLESDKFQWSLVVSPLSSVLAYFFIIFMERFLGKDLKVKAMDKQCYRVKFMKILETVTSW